MSVRCLLFWTFISGVSFALLASCAGMFEGGFGGQAERSAPAPVRSGAATSRSAKTAPAAQEVAADAAPPASAPRGATGAGTQYVVAPGKEPTPPAQNPSARKRVYQATLELSVASVERARADIIEQAQTAGGYIESSADDTIVIRVPAARFDEVLTSVQSLGDVRSRSIQASDVTDQYADLSLRLKTAEASRARLYELLDQAKKAGERLAILREIRRLTEEIEQLRSSLDALGRLIEFSRITVHLVSRMQEQQVVRSAIPFAWIGALDPLRKTTTDLRKPIEISVPKDFAVFTQDRFIRAEAADGTRIRVGSVPNNPEGDTAFWAAALSFHLAKYYARTDALEAGKFHGVAFVSRDAKPYVYAVLAAVRDKEIIVAEIYLPNEQIAEQRLASLRAMLARATL